MKKIKRLSVCISQTDRQENPKPSHIRVFATPSHTWQAGVRRSVMLMSHLTQQDILLGKDQSTTDCLSFPANKSGLEVFELEFISVSSKSVAILRSVRGIFEAPSFDLKNILTRNSAICWEMKQTLI